MSAATSSPSCKELADVAVKMTREQEMAKVRERALDAAEERVLDTLLPKPRMMGFSTDEPAHARDAETRQKFRKMLREHELDDREIEIELRALPNGRGDHGAAGHGGDAAAAAVHVPEPGRQPYPHPQGEGRRGAQAAHRRGGRQAHQRG